MNKQNISAKEWSSSLVSPSGAGRSGGKNILVFNSCSEKNIPFLALLNELKSENYYFKIFSSSPDAHNGAGKIYLGPNLNNKFNQIFFIVLLPFLFLTYLTYLSYYKIKKANKIICVNINEKIIITPIAKILKIKTVWIEDANSILLKNNVINKILLLIYKKISGFSKIITFNNFTKSGLKNLGLKEKNINVIYPGIRINNREHQNNLFNELAKTESKNYKRKFFTIGTVCELSKKQNLETLFQAVKTCLTVIPNMQLIIVGEGEERKNLSWLNKKMELGNITWFVGEQAHLKKWLDGFDIFAVTNELPQLSSINIILEAMTAKLPIIGPLNSGLEEIISNTECLIEKNNSEMLARKIIKLWREKRLRIKLGEDEKKRVEKYFTLNKMVEEIKKIV